MRLILRTPSRASLRHHVVSESYTKPTSCMAEPFRWDTNWLTASPRRQSLETCIAPFNKQRIRKIQFKEVLVHRSNSFRDPHFQIPGREDVDRKQSAQFADLQ